MPQRQDIKSVLIIGAGPTTIGQGGEFDYFIYEALTAFRSLGLKTIVVNSNPATVTTSPDLASVVYIEPLDLGTLIKILEKENPDSIFPATGGQTALNLTLQLDQCGALSTHKTRVLSFSADTIHRCEDRLEFKRLLSELGIGTLNSRPVFSLEEAEEVALEIGYPLAVRSSFTAAGSGSGICYNVQELRPVISRGLAVAMGGPVIIEESIEKWQQFEIEVLRDAEGNKLTAALIENLESMGINSGDSISVTPVQTLPAAQAQNLKGMAYNLLDKLAIEGTAGIKFAVNPDNNMLLPVKVYPGATLSSAFVSRATGLPIANIATKIAAGMLLKELGLGKFKQQDSMVGVTFPHFDFDRFPDAVDRLGTQMHATGTALGIGKTFSEALVKAIISLPDGIANWNVFDKEPLDAILERLSYSDSKRVFAISAALRKGASPIDIASRTDINFLFIERLAELVKTEKTILSGVGWNFIPKYDKSAADYWFSTNDNVDRQMPGEERNKKILILGPGPSRIGQGAEYGCLCKRVLDAVTDSGYEGVIIDNNPSSVALVPGENKKIYLEPVTIEHVLQLVEREKPEGVIVHLMGARSANFAKVIANNEANVLGTPYDSLKIFDDNKRLREILKENDIRIPKWEVARDIKEAQEAADTIGFPLVVTLKSKDSQRSQIVHDKEELEKYLGTTNSAEITIEQHFENAIGAEVDALCDGREVFIPAVTEHIEYTGINPGDAACVIPPVNIPEIHALIMEEYVRKIAMVFKIVGAINIQFAIGNDKVYVIAVTSGLSRNIPLVSRACHLPLAYLATRIILGKRLRDLGVNRCSPDYFSVKEAVFPFNMLPEVDPVLGTEMKSTGEVMGIAETFGLAYWKAQQSVSPLPTSGTVLITVADFDRPGAADVAKQFVALGFKIKATAGTRAYLVSHGILAETVLKEHEGRPNITDAIKNKEIQLVINTPTGKLGKYDDAYIREAAIKYKVPYITTLTAASAAAKGIAAFLTEGSNIKSIQEYYL
jgi:carbamoyl-phosphate synthase large subunit